MKSKKCHSMIAEHSAVAGLWEKYAAVDNEIEWQKQKCNVSFLCMRGCNACCSDYFYVSLLEYFAIKNHLITFAPETFAQAKLTAQKHNTLLSGQYPEEHVRLETTSVDIKNIFNDKSVIRKRFLPCPFLDSLSGDCQVYPARPLICRIYGLSYSYKKCELIDKYRKGPLGLFPRDLKKYMVGNEYGTAPDEGVDCFGMKITRPYPLFYWLSHDDDYEEIYSIACQRPMDEFIHKL